MPKFPKLRRKTNKNSIRERSVYYRKRLENALEMKYSTTDMDEENVMAKVAVALETCTGIQKSQLWIHVI